METDSGPFLRARKRTLLVFILLVLLISIVLILHNPSSAKRPIALISQNGVVIQEIDLSTVTETSTIRIDFPDGGYNLVAVAPGEIGVCEADCPDLLCVHMGMISNSAYPVTCLPHRLVLQIVYR